jgi:hypothetical protein
LRLLSWRFTVFWKGFGSFSPPTLRGRAPVQSKDAGVCHASGISASPLAQPDDGFWTPVSSNMSASISSAAPISCHWGSHLLESPIRGHFFLVWWLDATLLPGRRSQLGLPTGSAEHGLISGAAGTKVSFIVGVAIEAEIEAVEVLVAPLSRLGCLAMRELTSRPGTRLDV